MKFLLTDICLPCPGHQSIFSRRLFEAFNVTHDTLTASLGGLSAIVWVSMQRVR
jgi:hypothetical protein